jgi:hypothetical protein
VDWSISRGSTPEKPRKNARFFEAVLLRGKGLLVLDRAKMRGFEAAPPIPASSDFIVQNPLSISMMAHEGLKNGNWAV